MDKTQKYYGVCDVCCLIDGDKSHKMVVYCRICKAYICEKCIKDIYKRAVAMIKAKKHGLCSQKDKPKPI